MPVLRGAKTSPSAPDAYDQNEGVRPLRSLFMHSTKEGQLYRFTALVRVD